MGSGIRRAVLTGLAAAAVMGLGLGPDADLPLRAEVSPGADRPAPSPPLPAFNAGYGDYPARAFGGVPRPLRLTPPQRTYRTRLTEAYREPIDYGGSLVIAQIGCGTGCRNVYALDKSSGKAFAFPLGGEANLDLWIRYRADSALIWATWEPRYPTDCKAQPWVLGARGFVPLSEPLGIDCQLSRDTD